MSTEQHNRMMWDGKPGHYEVWYTTLSHRASQTGFWIRYTLTSPLPDRGEPTAKLWFARFDARNPEANFGINQRFPIGQLRSATEPFSIQIGDAQMRHDGLRGALSGGGHDVKWDLNWRPADTVHLHLPTMLYKGTFGDTRVLSPNLDVAARGEIVVDGQRYQLDGDPAGQSHVWGKKHAYQWGWSHCNAFDDKPGATFESISVQLKRGAVILPRLTLFTLRMDGETFEFREPWRLPLSRSSYLTGRYHLIGVTPETRVEAELTCRPEDMILTEYVDPDGDPAFCHNTCSGSMTATVSRRSAFVGRWREVARIKATNTAHWEWGARAGDAANVKHRHVTISNGKTL